MKTEIEFNPGFYIARAYKSANSIQEKERLLQLYFKSEHWKTISYNATVRSKFMCQECKTSPSRNVYHVTRDRIGEELDEDVIVLCEECRKSNCIDV